jgi:hypothetical protein
VERAGDIQRGTEIKFGLENLGKNIQCNNRESLDVGRRIILSWILKK